MTGQTTTPESGVPDLYFFKQISSAGQERNLALDMYEGTLSAECYEPVILHPLEAQLFYLLANSPNEPFKPADIISEITAFQDEYAPPPSEVIKRLSDKAPVLAGHLFAHIKGSTQFLSYMDTHNNGEIVKSNIEKRLEKNVDPRRKAKIIAGISAAVSAAGTASAILGYRYHQKGKKSSS